MNKVKLWLEQWIMVSFAILAGIVLEGVVYALMDGDDLGAFSLNWYQMLSVILTGMICGIPTVLLLEDEGHSKIPSWLRNVLHFFCTYLLVIGMGKVFSWYTNPFGFVMVTMIYVLVYAFVWAVTAWFHKQEDNKINKALDDIRDEE